MRDFLEDACLFLWRWVYFVTAVVLAVVAYVVMGLCGLARKLLS